MKRILVLTLAVFVMMLISFGTVYAEEVDPAEPETVITYEPETIAPETEPVPETEIEPETIEPETVAPETEPETFEPETEVETEVVTETEPETEYYQEETQPVTYDVNKLPTLVDSTQVAEDLPTAIGADSNSGGVSKIGGIVCWIGVAVAVAVILACLFSTRGKSKSGVGRFESGNKFGSSNYGGRYR